MRFKQRIEKEVRCRWCAVGAHGPDQLSCSDISAALLLGRYLLPEKLRQSTDAMQLCSGQHCCSRATGHSNLSSLRLLTAIDQGLLQETLVGSTWQTYPQLCTSHLDTDLQISPSPNWTRLDSSQSLAHAHLQGKGICSRASSLKCLKPT